MRRSLLLGTATISGSSGSERTDRPGRRRRKVEIGDEVRVGDGWWRAQLRAHTRAGQAWCWGRNVYGQLGDGTNINRDVPDARRRSARASRRSTRRAPTRAAPLPTARRGAGASTSKGSWVTARATHHARPTRVTLAGTLSMRSLARAAAGAARCVLSSCGLATACKGIGDITAPRAGGDTGRRRSVAVERTVTLAEGQQRRAAGHGASMQTTIGWPIARCSGRAATRRSRVSQPAGLVTGVRAGTAQIAASVDGRSAMARLTVIARAVASVQITPAAPSLLVGGFVQLTARTSTRRDGAHWATAGLLEHERYARRGGRRAGLRDRRGTGRGDRDGDQ